MHIKTNYSLRTLNTFGVETKADYYVDIHSDEDLEKLSVHELLTNNSILILGGGSNILFTGDFRGLVIHPKFMGIEQIDEDERSVIVRAGSGVIWDDFVRHAVNYGWGGVENLSIIPGNVGASPIQNIGAYGVEVKEVIEKVEGFHLSKRIFSDYSGSDCQFGYRTSIFKHELKNDFLITHVTFRLLKPPHVLSTGYGAVEEKLRTYHERSISAVREVITEIRNAKLPDPDKIGNAGSFFKNPVIQNDMASDLKKRFPDIPLYPAENSNSKLSAAWLIDKVRCKGIRKGNAGTHDKQPLVLINLGNATGNEIIQLAEYIRKKVEKKFGVRLESEVNII